MAEQAVYQAGTDNGRKRALREMKKKRLRFICAVCAACMTVLGAGALAGGGGEIQEETVVSLVWEGSATGVKTTWWNEQAVQIHTEDVGLGSGKIRDYVGVTLFDLMKLAGADGCDMTDLRCLAPVVCRLMDLPPDGFDLGVPALLETQDRTAFGR